MNWGFYNDPDMDTLLNAASAAFDPAELARRLSEQPGVVEHGLFLRGRPVVYVAGADGTVRRED